MLFGTSTILLASVLATFAAAQSTTVSQSMPATATAGFNPGAVSSTDRFNWCHAQLNTCPQICSPGIASINSCDQNALTYACTCSNGTTPDVTAYTLTLPFYICQATYAQCIQNHPNDAQAQQACTDAEVCGSKNATAIAAAASSAAAQPSTSSASSSSSTAASSTSSSSGTASAASGSASASASKAAAATTQQIATGAFAAIMMAAFKLFL